MLDSMKMLVPTATERSCADTGPRTQPRLTMKSAKPLTPPVSRIMTMRAPTTRVNKQHLGVTPVGNHQDELLDRAGGAEDRIEAGEDRRAEQETPAYSAR